MENKGKILLVEDDMSLALVTKDSLELRGYEVIHAENGEIGWQKYNKDSFDICILDVMLPKIDGFTLATQIRNKDQKIPIIFLTAKSLQEDKIQGLKLGADDYITKPFSVEEVSLKIEIFLKRTRPQPNEVQVVKKYNIGQYELDFDNLQLKIGTIIHKLTPREAEVLEYFALHPNVIMRREDILKKIWGKDDYFMGRSLDVFITRLRKYLKDDENIKIENIPGIGFRFIF